MTSSNKVAAIFGSNTFLSFRLPIISTKSDTCILWIIIILIPTIIKSKSLELSLLHFSISGAITSDCWTNNNPMLKFPHFHQLQSTVCTIARACAVSKKEFKRMMIYHLLFTFYRTLLFVIHILCEIECNSMCFCVRAETQR